MVSGLDTACPGVQCRALGEAGEKLKALNKGTQFVVAGTEVSAGIPGLQFSARGVRGQSVAGGFGGFHDLVPLDGGRWGLAVGDVSARPQGSGVPAAGSISVARAVMRAMAQIDGNPSAVLAGMNRALLALSPSEQCSLAVTYTTVRLSAVGVRVRICAAGPQTAFVRRADASVLAITWPGSPLGLRPDPELSSSRVLLRTGDTMILVSASVAQALGGPDRVCRILAGAGRASAARSTETLARAVREAGSGQMQHEAVVLALKVPGNKREPGLHSAGWPGDRPYTAAGPPAYRPWTRRQLADRMHYPFLGRPTAGSAAGRSGPAR